MNKINFQEEITRKLLNKYDKNNDKTLDSVEISNMMSDSNNFFNFYNQSQQLDLNVFQEVLDVNNDGKVCGQDLRNLYQSYFGGRIEKKITTKLFSVESEKKISVARKLFAQSYSLKQLEFDDLEKLLQKILHELQILINFEVLKACLSELYTDKMNINSLDQFQDFFISCLEKLGINIEYDVF